MNILAVTHDAFTATDGESISYYKWPAAPEIEQKAVVLLVHGLADHANRYAHFASFLNSHGYTVYAHDQRGHGTTAGVEKLGIYEGDNFWEDALDDLRTFQLFIEKEEPGQAIILFGHSMGSLLSRHYVSKYGSELKAAVFSGTAPFIRILGTIGIFLSQMIQMIYGRNSVSPFLKSLFFNEFNRQFKPNRTELDWVSRDNAVVDKFEADPYRGIDFQTGFFLHILKGFRSANASKVFQSTPTDLPIFLFSGDRDPVGENGKGVRRVFESYKQAGIKDISLKLYDGGRHEMLNEINQKEVYEDVLIWIQEKVETTD